MKKFRFLALIAMICVIGTVFAATTYDWTFIKESNSKEQVAEVVTNAEQEVSVENLGTWSVTSKTLKIVFENPNANGYGYNVKGTVSGSIVYTYTVSEGYDKNLVNNIAITSSLNTSDLTIAKNPENGNVGVVVSFDSTKVDVVNDPTAGTITVTVPSTAISVSCTGAFTSVTDYNTFASKVGALQPKVTVTASANYTQA